MHRILCASLVSICAIGNAANPKARPNVLLVFADQWRAEAFGFAGNPDVKTPNADKFHAEGITFANAVSTTPVCSPYRASLLTGQRPLTHGVFMNDVPLKPEAVSFGDVLSAAGYATGWIGKWHVDGHGRSEFIPRERRQGFEYWKVLECTHSYNNSPYYADVPQKLKWEGYDAIAQTHDTQEYIRSRAKSGQPFALVISWGPPHDPYQSAPARFRDIYAPDQVTLRPNVPTDERARAAEIATGYYAHCSALDECLGSLRKTLAETGIEENTLLIFTSDHGDMLGSHGLYKKQKPYDESIRVPLIFRWPAGLGTKPRVLDCPITPEDIMPTMLDLCGVSVPKSCEGVSHAAYLRGKRDPCGGVALIQSITPFGEWEREKGGREYRGLRTTRYTYVRDLNGPWLLFDNQTDPWQTNNLVNISSAANVQHALDRMLALKLKARDDHFRPGKEYIAKWGYTVDERGTVPYWRTVSRQLPLPSRSANALPGSQLIPALEPMSRDERENRLYEEILAGNIPNWNRRFVPVPFSGTANGSNYSGALDVLPDYLAVGSDSDNFLAPMTPMLAQKVADHLGCILPTRKMVDLIWSNAAVKLDPQPIPPSPAMSTVPVFARHNVMIQEQRSLHTNSHPLGALVAGHKKDLVLSSKIYTNFATTTRKPVVIYGWLRTNGAPIQPLYNGHVETYVDYSHGVRLVWAEASVNRKVVPITNILTDPNLATLLSDEGPVEGTTNGVIAVPRYPVSP